MTINPGGRWDRQQRLCDAFGPGSRASRRANLRCPAPTGFDPYREAAQPLIARLNDWEGRLNWVPRDSKRLEVRCGDLRRLRAAFAVNEFDHVCQQEADEREDEAELHTEEK